MNDTLADALKKHHLLLKALDNLSDEPPGHAVRLDHDEGLLVVCHCARLAFSNARLLLRGRRSYHSKQKEH